MLQLIRKGDPSRAALDERMFKGGRLTIGRGDNAGWRLADDGRVLSKIHCEIFNRGEDVFLIDCSTNGVFLNGARARMTPNEPVQIREGDGFAIGDYEIVACAPKGKRPADDMFGESSRSGPLDKVDIGGDWLGEDDAAPATLGSPVRRPVADLIDDIGTPPRDPFADAGRDAFPESPRGRGELSEAFIRPLLAEPLALPSGGGIPDDWDSPSVGARGAAPAAPQETLPPEPPRAVSRPVERAPIPPETPLRRNEATPDALAAFLEGAGLDASAFGDVPDTEILRRAGAIYRQAVLNYSDILRDRSFLKNEFRIERTIVGAQGNNPLKFLNAQQAAVRLLQPPESGFVDGAAAIREAGEDIKKHQIAVMSGLRMALQALLDRFRPSGLLGAEQKKSGLRLPGAEQAEIARAWERFKILHSTCEEDAAQRTDNFLNNAFRRGYEMQMERLESGQSSGSDDNR